MELNVNNAVKNLFVDIWRARRFFSISNKVIFTNIKQEGRKLLKS